MKTTYWNVELAPEAKNDFADIIRWTRKKFGERQVQIYGTTIKESLQALHAGPNIIGVKQRDDLGARIHALHIARNGRKGRHFILFRIAQPHTIEVLRILHDSMDLPARLAD